MDVNCIITITIMVYLEWAIKCFRSEKISDSCLQLHLVVTVVKSAVMVTKIATIYFYAHVSMWGDAARVTLSRLSKIGFVKALSIAAHFVAWPAASYTILKKLEYYFEIGSILNCYKISVNDAHWLWYVHELIPLDKRFEGWKFDGKPAKGRLGYRVNFFAAYYLLYGEIDSINDWAINAPRSFEVISRGTFWILLRLVKGQDLVTRAIGWCGGVTWNKWIIRKSSIYSMVNTTTGWLTCNRILIQCQR